MISSKCFRCREPSVYRLCESCRVMDTLGSYEEKAVFRLAQDPRIIAAVEAELCKKPTEAIIKAVLEKIASKTTCCSKCELPSFCHCPSEIETSQYGDETKGWAHDIPQLAARLAGEGEG